MWARLLSRNRRNLESVLWLDSQQHEQAATLLYEEGSAGTFENRVVAAAGTEEEVWQLLGVSWEDIAEAVWNKQSDLFVHCPDNPYLEREIEDDADLADMNLQREEAGGAIRDNSGSDPSTTRTASTTSVSRASGDSSGRESTEDDNSDESTVDGKAKRWRGKKARRTNKVPVPAKKRGAGGEKKAQTSSKRRRVG